MVGQVPQGTDAETKIACKSLGKGRGGGGQEREGNGCSDWTKTEAVCDVHTTEAPVNPPALEQVA